MKVHTVHPAELRRWWGFARPLVDEVRTVCKEPWIPDDVYANLKAERALLHIFITEGPKGCAVTEVCGEPDSRFLNVWILHFVHQADNNREDLLAWVDGLARSYQLSTIRFQSPRAWASLLKGAFKEKSVTFERVI